MGIGLDKLVQDVMAKLLQGDGAVLEVLRKQYKQAKVVNIEKSGAGFYAQFCVQKSAQKIQDGKIRYFGDVVGEINGLTEGVGFVLFIENGKISLLEGYAFSDEWSEDIRHYRLNHDSDLGRDLPWKRSGQFE